MERVVDPIVADLQLEYAAAGSDVWRRRRALWLGYAGFWKAVIQLAAHAVIRPAERNEEPMLGRSVAFSTLGFVLFTILLVLPPLADGVRWSGGLAHGAVLTLTLIPQAMPLSIPAGVCLGVLCAMRGRAATNRHLCGVLTIGILASAFAWAMLEWGVPRANQQFRELVMAQLTDGRPYHLEPGLNELGLSRLGQRTDGEAVRHYHLSWAVSFAAIPLAVFALAAAGRVRRLVPAVALAATTLLGYVGVMWACATLSHGTLPQVIATAWAPNLLLVTVGGIMLGLRRLQDRQDGIAGE
jgi:hypothetical protein